MCIRDSRNASRADNGKKPMEAFPIVAAIDGNRLARAKRDGLTQEDVYKRQPLTRLATRA